MRGDDCDEQLVCAAQREANSTRDAGACITTSHSVGAVECECTQTRRIAVFASKVLPKIRREYGADYDSDVRRMFDKVPPSLPVIAVFVALFLLLALAAWRADLATIFVARAPPCFYPTSLRQLFALNLRLHCSWMRPFNIVPGYIRQSARYMYLDGSW